MTEHQGVINWQTEIRNTCEKQKQWINFWWQETCRSGIWPKIDQEIPGCIGIICHQIAVHRIFLTTLSIIEDAPLVILAVTLVQLLCSIMWLALITSMTECKAREDTRENGCWEIKTALRMDPSQECWIEVMIIWTETCSYSPYNYEKTSGRCGFLRIKENNVVSWLLARFAIVQDPSSGWKVH